ncbi:DUF659 domain-containing protein [Roseivirga pacifica]|uniref:DUF659 domain-containing protein n=1 Tax=Roseivirga pacifica TaxID=1267423 RepID=UPI0020958C42|nr:DUF659 domain-containing protein [Roseivirga pacifica]MCO6360759.1 hypothetical protein [Roseivirga pacifica]MCO6368648.1 hypothetical protein [Roseivirga pacifica]MCO6372791.1 hypothetical protein [Roseivirga pacifica]MCO6376850.1 hypothetical protein [Roseivirga pacifica]MCO6377872.1 hypothetical protein [Roseivirga pacifica]
MKRIIGCALVALLALNSCDKTDISNCAEVKIVEQICGQYVLQVVSGNLDGKLTDGWKSAYDEKVYDNVFFTYMPCESNLPDDPSETFFVKAVEERTTGDCIVCRAMLANAPETTIAVEVVSFCEADGLTD